MADRATGATRTTAATAIPMSMYAIIRRLSLPASLLHHRSFQERDTQEADDLGASTGTYL